MDSEVHTEHRDAERQTRERKTAQPPSRAGSYVLDGMRLLHAEACAEKGQTRTKRSAPGQVLPPAAKLPCRSSHSDALKQTLATVKDEIQQLQQNIGKSSCAKYPDKSAIGEAHREHDVS